MCLYTPKGTKKRVRGSSSGTKSSTRSTSAPNKHRQPLPRNIVVNQPAPITQPTVLPQYQQPRIEIEGVGATTNIYLPSPALTQTGQSQDQGQSGGQQGGNGQQQNLNGNQGQERRRSSTIVSEVEGVMRLARRVGDAVRRGSASSLARGRDYYREETRRKRSRERRSDRHGRRHERTPSSSRSRSRERRTQDKRLMGTVDEEARQMARYAGGMAEGLVREREVKKEAKRVAEKKREDDERMEERLADRVLSRYGSGGLLGPPPPPRGLLRGVGDWRDGRDGRDWRDGVSWAPWNAAAVGMNYGVAPPMPLTTQSTSGTNDGGGNSGDDGGRGGRGGRSEGMGASNHIHVHTAPLVQGPQISTTPGSSGGYAEMPGMVVGANSAALPRRSSWVEIPRNMARLLERGMGGYSHGMPGIQSHFSGGVNPIHGMGMGVAGAVPIGEREWQRARVYSSHAPENGLSGMMY